MVYGLVWFGMDQYGLVWFGLVLFCWYSLVWRGEGFQMTSEFIHEEISMMDYNGLS